MSRVLGSPFRRHPTGPYLLRRPHSPHRLLPRRVRSPARLAHRAAFRRAGSPLPVLTRPGQQPAWHGHRNASCRLLRCLCRLARIHPPFSNRPGPFRIRRGGARRRGLRVVARLESCGRSRRRPRPVGHEQDPRPRQVSSHHRRHGRSSAPFHGRRGDTARRHCRRSHPRPRPSSARPPPPRPLPPTNRPARASEPWPLSPSLRS